MMSIEVPAIDKRHGLPLFVEIAVALAGYPALEVQAMRSGHLIIAVLPADVFWASGADVRLSID